MASSRFPLAQTAPQLLGLQYFVGTAGLTVVVVVLVVTEPVAPQAVIVV